MVDSRQYPLIYSNRASSSLTFILKRTSAARLQPFDLLTMANLLYRPSILLRSSMASACLRTAFRPLVNASSSQTLFTIRRAFTIPAAFRPDSKRGPFQRRPGRRAAKLIGKIKVRANRTKTTTVKADQATFFWITGKEKETPCRKA